MKIPKVIMRFCKKCKTHTEHKVSSAKRRTPGATHPMSYGSKKRARRRGAARGMGNLGRYSRKAVSAFKMSGKKTSKKTDFRYECKNCKKISVQRKGIRTKRIEFV